MNEESRLPVYYTLVHPAAKLADVTRQAFIDGLVATFGNKDDSEREERD